MNKILLFAVCLLVTGAACHAQSDADSDLAERLLEGEHSAPVFEDSHEGYDLHKDHFYFDDKLVEKAYKRSDYTSTKITLAGQRPDITGKKVSPAVNPFVVAQKAMAPLGSSADRWDVKEDAHGNQYAAIYHGDGFVVNKLRGQFLRRLANSIKDYLPILDAAAPESQATIKETIVDLVTDLIKEVDNGIRSSMKDKDGSSSTATVVAISKKNLVVVNVGQGKILAYDDTSLMSELTSKSTELDGAQYCQSFGNAKNRFDMCRAFVEIIPRTMKDTSEDADEDDTKTLQLLVLETPVVAEMITTSQVETNVARQINQHKMIPDHEQEMFTSAVNGIIKSAESGLSTFKKWALADATVMMIALEKNYRNIH